MLVEGEQQKGRRHPHIRRGRGRLVRDNDRSRKGRGSGRGIGIGIGIGISTRIVAVIGSCVDAREQRRHERDVQHLLVAEAEHIGKRGGSLRRHRGKSISRQRGRVEQRDLDVVERLVVVAEVEQRTPVELRILQPVQHRKLLSRFLLPRRVSL